MSTYKYKPDMSGTYWGEEGVLPLSPYLYGSKYRDDYLLHDNEMLPLYGPLARKALMHYAGDRYNPHTVNLSDEYFVRYLIKEMVTHKVLNRLPGYDWEYNGHLLRRYIENTFGLPPTYDEKLLARGPRREFIAVFPNTLMN